MKEGCVGAAKLICIGGSTGAPLLAATLIEQLPEELDAAVLLALHIPAPLVASFVASVGNRSTLPIEMAMDGLEPQAGHVYVSPGAMHIGVNRSGRMVVTSRPDATPVKPSIDILFHTASQVFGQRVFAVVLKGLTLKRDARQGALSVKAAGGRVLVQCDPEDALFGMTRDVIDAGGATDQVAIDKLPDALVKYVGKRPFVVKN